MTLQQVIEALSLDVVCPPADPSRTVGGVYAGDLLSRAMSHVQADDLWITIMNNANVAAVAHLTDAAAILLAEDVCLLPDALEAAKNNHIAVVSSDKSVYELCRDIANILPSDV